MSVAVAIIDDIGVFSDVAKLAVTDGSAVSHTVTTGKRGVVFMNVGAKLCWMGGSTVDATNQRGVIVLPRVYFIFRQVASDFQVFFQCETGDSTTIGIAEYG